MGHVVASAGISSRTSRWHFR